jgi:pimeloyl-ACP methyl ester carboxylesterase
MVWFGVSNGGIIGLHLSSGALKGKILSLVLGDIAPELNPVAIARIRSYTGTTPFFTGLAEAKTFFKATYAQFGYLSEAEWTQLTIRSVRREKKEAEGGGAEVVNGFSPHYDPRIFSKELTLDTSMLPDTLWACLDGCGCPVLLLHGKKSDLITEETVEKMRSKPHVQVVSFDDCGHTPQLNVEHQFKIFEEFVSKVD